MPRRSDLVAARQKIQISGMGLDTFSENGAGIRAAFDRLDRLVPRDALTWGNTQPNDQVVMASSRYFTPRRFTKNETTEPFTKAEDPSGRLARAAGTGLVHIRDNVVEYYIKTDGMAL